jgi:hypothetical protein
MISISILRLFLFFLGLRMLQSTTRSFYGKTEIRSVPAAAGDCMLKHAPPGRMALCDAADGLGCSGQA